MQDYPELPLERIRSVASKARILLAIVILTMFVGTHFPIANGLPGSQADKLYHFGAYLTLTLCLLGSWELSTGILQASHYFVVWLFGTLYGVFDEVTQPFVGRYCDGADWLADLIGIVAGLILFCLARPLMYRVIRPSRAVSVSIHHS